jgi:hypothetical protein
MPAKEKILWSVPETAEATGMDVKTVRKQLESGKIPGERFGRIWKVPAWWINRQKDGVPSKVA